MGPRPWKPDAELDGALERGDLRYAVTLATEVAEFDAWALRWLARWASETPATIEQAAEVAASLADLPSEPVAALDALRHAC